jgi:hypothetical protein
VQVRFLSAPLKSHLTNSGKWLTDSDSFVKRIRRKSGVYGEHILFPLTVQGIEWALERRQRFPGFSADARLLVNAKGTPLDTPTKEGNATQLIPNHFARLIKWIQVLKHS